MLAYILQRLAQSIFVLLVVAVIAFALFNYVGDPIHNMVGQETSMEERERLRQELGLNDPFYVQFTRFVTNAVRGDFGVSYRHGRHVSEHILCTACTRRRMEEEAGRADGARLWW